MIKGSTKIIKKYTNPLEVETGSAQKTKKRKTTMVTYLILTASKHYEILVQTMQKIGSQYTKYKTPVLSPLVFFVN